MLVPMERALDVYDDNGRLLIQYKDVLPQAFGQSPFLQKEAADALPDDLFALVLVDGASRLRKYACADPASTELSTIYFFHNYRNLTPEAVKVAARNLVEARDLYGLAPQPELAKLAETGGEPKGLGWVADPITGGSESGEATPGGQKPAQKLMPSEKIRPTGPDTMEPGESKDRANALEQLLLTYAEGRRLGGKELPDRREPMDETKKADLVGTEVMPIGQVPAKPKTVKKLASAGNVVVVSGRTVDDLWPFVKTASKHAGEFPIDTLPQIRALEEKFASDLPSIPPYARHPIARALASREDELGLTPGEKVAHYAGQYYQDAEQLVAAISMREKLAHYLGKTVDYSLLVDARKFLPAEQYAQKLAELDRSNGFERFWGTQWINDPWAETLAAEKRANIVYSKDDVFVADKHLEWLAKHHRTDLCRILDEDVVEEFSKNPVSVFGSLPDPLKKTIGRLAMDRNWTPGFKETSR